MGGVHQAMHGGIDRRRCAALAVQAVIERGHHFVFTLDAGVNGLECLQPVQPEHSKVLSLQGAEIATGALDPQELNILTRHRVLLHALGGGVAAREVGVPLVRAEAVGTVDQFFNSLAHGVTRPIRLAGRLRGPR